MSIARTLGPFSPRHRFEQLECRRLFADTYNVAAYGAVPNDGLDDRAAIQAAMNASRNSGGAVDSI